MSDKTTAVSGFNGLTAKERLAISRKAIVRHMHKDDHHAGEASLQDDAGNAFGHDATSVPAGNWGLFKHALISWWHHHPANLALDIGRPLISKYAQAHPVKLMAIAAGVGVLVVVTRPWRLVSLGSVLLAALKSADISSAVMSMVLGSNAKTHSP